MQVIAKGVREEFKATLEFYDTELPPFQNGVIQFLQSIEITTRLLGRNLLSFF